MGKILQVGEELDGGRLEVVGELQSVGQYAEIYVVHKTRAPLECILKVNLPHDMLDKEAVAESTYEFSKEDHIVRTQREARMLCSFADDNIIKLDDVIDIKDGRFKGLLFIPSNAYKTVDTVHYDFGLSYSNLDMNVQTNKLRTLRDIIDNEVISCSFKKLFFINLARGLFNTLNALRSSGMITKNVQSERNKHSLDSRTLFLFGPYIVHRDIRPENVLVEEGGKPYLIDFGLACRLGQHEGKWGSKKYAPPETYLGKGDNDSDAWQMGLCLYEFLSGKHLMDDSSTPSREKICEKVKGLNNIDSCVKFYDELIKKFEALKSIYIGDEKEDLDRDFMACLTVTAYFCQPLHLLPPIERDSIKVTERKINFWWDVFDKKKYEPSEELRKTQKELLRLKR